MTNSQPPIYLIYNHMAMLFYVANPASSKKRWRLVEKADEATGYSSLSLAENTLIALLHEEIQDDTAEKKYLVESRDMLTKRIWQPVRYLKVTRGEENSVYFEKEYLVPAEYKAPISREPHLPLAWRWSKDQDNMVFFSEWSAKKALAYAMHEATEHRWAIVERNTEREDGYAPLRDLEIHNGKANRACCSMS